MLAVIPVLVDGCGLLARFTGSSMMVELELFALGFSARPWLPVCWVVSEVSPCSVLAAPLLYVTLSPD